MGYSFCLLLSNAREYLEYMLLIRFINLSLVTKYTFRIRTGAFSKSKAVSSSNSSLEPGSLRSFTDEDGNTKDDALQK